MRSGEQPGAASDTTAPVAAISSMQLVVGGRVGAVGAAGEHGDGGATGGEGTAVGRVVDAEGRTRDHRHPRVAAAGADLAGHGLAVGRWRRASRRRRPSRRGRTSRSGPRTHSPIGTPPRSCSGPGAARRSSRDAGHSSSPGTTNRSPTRVARSSSAAGSTSASRTAMSAGSPSVALAATAGRGRSSAPSSVDQPGEPQVTRLAEPVERHPGEPVVVGDGSSGPPDPLDGHEQRLPGAQPQGGGDLLGSRLDLAPEATEARSATVERQPVHPDRAAAAEPSGVERLVEGAAGVVGAAATARAAPGRARGR